MDPIQRSLDELLQAKVIDIQTAEDITRYFKQKQESSPNRLLIALSIMGALFIGIGLILIVGHNWDDLSRPLKTIFAFMPLIAAQVLCFIGLKKKENTGLTEGASAFLFFSIGACMAMISQIYHLGGSLEDFLLAWLVLCLPIMYVMRSNLSALLYVAFITWYGALKGYWHYPVEPPFLYLALLAGIIPYYLFLFKTKKEGNFMVFLNWMIGISLLINLAALLRESYVAPLTYTLLLGVYFLYGSRFFSDKRSIANGFKLLGLFGLLAMLFFYSFDSAWISLHYKPDYHHGLRLLESLPFALPLIGISLYLIWPKLKDFNLSKIDPLELSPLVFYLIWLAGSTAPFIGIVSVNLFLLLTGIAKLFEGNRTFSLGTMNLGLLIIMVLIICRFFDIDLSFLVRGFVFILLGAGFLFMNFRMIKRKKNIQLLGHE
jgi:uncharacterized membrane protein